jgi:hypothetical protein
VDAAFNTTGYQIASDNEHVMYIQPQHMEAVAAVLTKHAAEAAAAARAAAKERAAAFTAKKEAAAAAAAAKADQAP